MAETRSSPNFMWRVRASQNPVVSSQGEAHLEGTPVGGFPWWIPLSGVSWWVIRSWWVGWTIPRVMRGLKTPLTYTVSSTVSRTWCHGSVWRQDGPGSRLWLNKWFSVSWAIHWRSLNYMEIIVTHRHGASDTTQTCCLSSRGLAPSPWSLGALFPSSSLCYCCLTFLRGSPVFSFPCIIFLPPFKTVYF